MTNPEVDPNDPLGGPRSLAREIVETLREPFLVLDADGIVLAANAAFCTEFALTTHRVIGAPLTAAGSGEWDVPELHNLLRDLASASDSVEGYEFALRSFASAARPVRANLRPLRSGAGGVRMILLSLEPLRAPGPSLASLATDQRSDLVAVYDTGGSCLFIGEACEAMLGFSRAEMEHRQPCAALLPRDRVRLTDLLADLRDGAEPARFTFRIRHKDGRPLWFETLIRATPGPSGVPVLHTVSRDVTERQRAEDTLRWLSRQTRLILDATADGIFGVDRRGMVTFANPAAARLLGQEAAAMVGEPYSRFVDHDPQAAPHQDCIVATLNDGIPRDVGDGRFWRRGGASFDVEFSCTPAYDFGQVVGAVVSFRDVTGRRREEAKRRHSDWLADVGDINEPLSALLAEAALLDAGSGTPDEHRATIAAMIHSAKRIGEVVRRMGDGPARSDDWTDGVPVRSSRALALR